jgi:transcriptional regulator with XRE-family HTH domain
MKNLKDLGYKIKQVRSEQKLSQASLAEKICVDPTLLSKIENGHIQPTQKQLQAIINALALDERESLELWTLSGRYGGFVTTQRTNNSDLERIKDMSTPKAQDQSTQPVSFNIDPSRPTLYSDMAVVVSSINGMTLQFGQIVPGSGAVNVVSSIGVSFEHAKQIAEAISNELARNER